MLNDLRQDIDQLLSAYEQFFVEFDQAIRLLRSLHDRQPSEVERQDFFVLLSQSIFTKPLPTVTGRNSNNVHALIIRALSRFGPTERMAEPIFSLIVGPETDRMERWAQSIGYPLASSITECGSRFDEPTLSALTFQCVVAEQRASEVSGSQNVLAALNKIKESIDFVRFNRLRDKLAPQADVPLKFNQPSQSFVSNLENGPIPISPNELGKKAFSEALVDLCIQRNVTLATPIKWQADQHDRWWVEITVGEEVKRWPIEATDLRSFANDVAVLNRMMSTIATYVVPGDGMRPVNWRVSLTG